jgi:adenosine kinase
VVIVTLGEKGSQITAEGHRIEIPVAPPVKIADPTGVGDAYRGGLLKGFAHGASWKIAGRLGAVAAAYCLEVVGTQSQKYTRTEFLARYEHTFGKEPLVQTIMA